MTDPRMWLAVAIFALGVGAGFLIWGRQARVVTEGYAVPVHQDDGSVIAEKNPAKAPPTVRAPMLPKGARVLRTVEATVKPVQPGCAPVTTRTDIVQLPDGTTRAITLADDSADVLAATDWTHGPTLVQRRTPWAVGLAHTAGGDGPSVEWQTGRLRLGADALIAQDGRVTTVGRILWVFGR